MDRCDGFESLFEIVETAGEQVYGIGEVSVYDTALHIGAYHEWEPNEIYLHAGTREGAKALGFDGRRRTIRPDELPEAFQRLKPREIEDCLCIYKDDLKRIVRANRPGELQSTPWYQ